MEAGIYFDYNATTPLASEVVHAIKDSLTTMWANPSSNYEPGKLAKRAIENARGHVAAMLSAKPNDIVFTSGGTEANNLVIHTAMENYRRTAAALNGPPPHVITSEIEHDAIKLPLEHFQRRGELDVSFLPVSKVTGCIDARDVLGAIRATTCLITIMLANNETGVIQPLREIIEKVRESEKKQRAAPCRILIHTDAAQAIGKISVSVQDLEVDYLTIVGHKFYGPRIGALYVRDLGTECPVYPQFFGGGQERSYRPGTENTPMIIGLGKASELVTKNVLNYSKHFSDKKAYLQRKLLEAFGSELHINNNFGMAQILPNTLNVSIVGENFQGYKVLKKCKRLMASVGAACHADGGPSSILLACGISKELAANALRLSVGRETENSDIDNIVEDLVQAVNALKIIQS